MSKGEQPARDLPCEYCGEKHDLRCPHVKVIEYSERHGEMKKRIEFFPAHEVGETVMNVHVQPPGSDYIASLLAAVIQRYLGGQTTITHAEFDNAPGLGIGAYDEGIRINVVLRK